MSLFADKYQPTSLSTLDYGSNMGQILDSLAQSEQLPHLILEGARGSGKKTRVNLFLKAKYGSFNTSRILMHLKIPGKSEEKELNVLASRYHYQLNPNIHNVYDRTLMQSFVNTVVQCEIISGLPYRIIIIEDADLLTTEAQESLRKTLETYIQKCRFIFLCNREGHIIDPLYSRCVKIEVSSPTEEEIQKILRNISEKESMSTVKDEIIVSIAKESQRDMSRALRYLEKYLMRCEKYPGFDLRMYDSVYHYCTKIVETMISGTDIVTTMDHVRTQLYELVNYCTNNRELLGILLTIALNRIPKTSHNERFLLCQMAATRDESIRLSSKSVYHVEGFCLYIFGVIKTIMEQKSKAKSTIVRKK